jgi:ribose 5-phosphate isomerase A
VNPKQIAAERAVSYIQDGMTVGLGTGSTAAYAIHALGRRFQAESLRLRCIATSRESEELGLTYGLTFAAFEAVSSFDITIDGADEVDPAFRLIKGGGGALVREKIVAAATRTEIIVVDEGKVKTALGAHPLPVAILPYAWQWTQARIQDRFGIPAPRRLISADAPFLSDDGLYVLDLAFGAPLPAPDTLEQRLKTIIGVVEVGLFVGLCHHLIVGFDDGHIEEKKPHP